MLSVRRIPVARRVKDRPYFVTLYRIEDAAGHRRQLTVGWWKIKW